MKLFTIAFLLIAGNTFAQRGQFGVFYSADFPNKNIMPNMSMLNSGGIRGAYQPFFNVPLLLELKGSIGNYSHKSIPQTYIFSNNDQTTVDVKYNSNINKLLFGTRLQLGSEYRLMNYYIMPQIGGVFINSKIYIEDPTTAQGECRALEKSHPHRSSVGVYGGEIGTQINLSRNSSGFKHRLNIGVSFLNGFKPIDYINVKYMKEGPQGVSGEDHSHTSGDRELTATFINVSSQATHNHKIAELYRTNFQMWGFNIGYTIVF